MELLLDYFRFEAFLSRLDDVAMAQRYHEFKVFARASGGPVVRTTLIELSGDTSDAVCARLVGECSERIAAGAATVAGGPAFFAAARTEAAARRSTIDRDVLARQRDAHGYLRDIPAAAPLRADVAAFLTTVPASLGTTLEIGAGTGRLARELQSRALRYVCVDLIPSALPNRDTILNSVAADFQHLPFPAGTFDSIIANNVLEHAADPLSALVELRRVLAPSGRLYALIPLDALSARYALPAHLWKADMPSIARALARAGFSTIQADGINMYALGIAGAFPSCFGWVCRLVAGVADPSSCAAS